VNGLPQPLGQVGRAAFVEAREGQLDRGPRRGALAVGGERLVARRGGAGGLAPGIGFGDRVRSRLRRCHARCAGQQRGKAGIAGELAACAHDLQRQARH
jgi:hypothetical protein